MQDLSSTEFSGELPSKKGRQDSKIYINTVSQVVSAAPAAASFTTDIPVINFDNGAVQVVWSGVNGTASTFRLMGSANNGVDFSNLTASATTLNTTASSQLFAITDEGYTTIRCVYVAATSTVGSIDVWVNKKSRK